MLFTKGEARSIVRKCRPNGLEAWRKLTDRFDPPTVHHKAAMLTKLNNPVRVKKLVDIGKAVEEWEGLLRRYSEQEAEPIPEAMKKAALMRIVPEDLERHLSLACSRIGGGGDLHL